MTLTDFVVIALEIMKFRLGVTCNTGIVLAVKKKKKSRVHFDSEMRPNLPHQVLVKSTNSNKKK